MDNMHFNDKNGTNNARFRQSIQSIEKLEAEKVNINDEVSAIYKDLKDQGYDPRIVKMLLKVRKMDLEKYEQDAEELSMYMSLLGMKANIEE